MHFFSILNILIPWYFCIEPYILFHEFTHILDAETYARGDKVKYATSSGFTEYHASQIELLKMLGANSANEHISFSTKKMVKTIGIHLKANSVTTWTNLEKHLKI